MALEPFEQITSTIARRLAKRFDRSQWALIATPAPTLLRDDIVLHVDLRSGCVWRVFNASGRRELASQPCKRAKGMQRNSKPVPPNLLVRDDSKLAPRIHTSTAERKFQ